MVPGTDDPSGRDAAAAATGAPARRVSPAQAARLLAAQDPVIARLVADAGLPRLRPAAESGFEALVRAIVYQQLAGRAAAAIHGRLIAALEGDVQPERLLALTPDELRAAGLSRAKIASLQDLAAKIMDGTVALSPRALSRQSDQEITDRLSSVRGIGRWTAEMFLLFQLRRLDIWPVGDLGVRKGFGLAWGIPTPTPRELELLGEPYHPYRSVVAWYCWRAAESTPVPVRVRSPGNGHRSMGERAAGRGLRMSCLTRGSERSLPVS